MVGYSVAAKKIDVTDECHARLRQLRQERGVQIKEWASQVLVTVIEELDHYEQATGPALRKLIDRGVVPVPKKKVTRYEETDPAAAADAVPFWLRRGEDKTDV